MAKEKHNFPNLVLVFVCFRSPHSPKKQKQIVFIVRNFLVNE